MGGWAHGIAQWFLDLHPFWQALIRVLVFVGPTLIFVPGLIWFERRKLSLMQDRHGPNRVGNITISARSKWAPSFLRGKKFHLSGLLQPIADGVKLFFKEEVTPSAVDRGIYFWAPALALFPAFALGGTIPFAPWPSLTPIADVNIGVLYFLAVSSLGVYGIVLSGYSSNNKYALLGGLRSSAQLISYELAMTISVACVALATGSLRMLDIVKAQEGWLWGGLPFFANWHIFTPWGFVAGIIFLICMVAETNRAPFDLPEAENELVAGYHTEYSSMKFAVFFMGEYAAMFIYGGIFVTLFFGGWHLLPVNWEGIARSVPALAWPANFFASLDYWLAPVWFVGKIYFVVNLYIWLRGSFPRLRYDQLMSLGWRSLLPLATANLIVVGLWLLAARIGQDTLGRFGPLLGALAGLLAGLLLWLIYRALSKPDPNAPITQTLPTRRVRMAGATAIGSNPAQTPATVDEVVA